MDTLTRPFAAIAVLTAVLAAGARAADPPLGPDSKPQAGVPRGEVLKFRFTSKRVFPGTVRDYWVYVPAQYRPETPACLYVNQDGVQWNAPVVFDNLIHKKEMPVTIGVFVMHGRVPAADPATALDRFNRSLEYDGLGDRYARFLLEELLPDVEKQKAADGRPIHLSKDPKDRAIGGASSGAICAFVAAWERPDQFSRVFSAIGTYVGLRGGDGFPTWIRKFEPKPIRVFLQDGSNDQNIYAGDWWMANQMMERALTFAGYEVEHAWGEGGHSGNHGTAIFPDAMRFLWKGWPEPVKAGQGRNQMLGEILVPGAPWEAVGSYRLLWGLMADGKGDVYYRAGTGGGPYRVPAGGKAEAQRRQVDAMAQAMGPAGFVYRVMRGGSLMVGPVEDEGRKVAEGFGAGTVLTAAASGNVYLAEPAGRELFSKLWLVTRDGHKRLLTNADGHPTGITLSPDQSLLYVVDGGSHWVDSYQVQGDGGLAHGQRYYWLHVPDDSGRAGAAGVAVDRDGRLYVATRLGVQVCDQAGRVNCILPLPNNTPAEGLCFGGEGGSTLYVTGGGGVWRRKLAIKGRQAFEPSNKPAPPRL